MRIDIGLVMGIVMECVLFIYYANTTFKPHFKLWIVNALTGIGYALILSINIFCIPNISIIGFSLINFLLLKYLYKMNFKSALFHSIILNLLSVIGEYVIIFILGVEYNIRTPEMMNEQQSIILTITSKFIYFVGMLLIKSMVKKKKEQQNEAILILALVPIMTIGVLTVMLGLNMDYISFWTICFCFLLINIIIFAFNELMVIKNNQIKYLAEENLKNRVEMTEYKMLADNYENIRIMEHDFKKQLKALESLIVEDNVQAQKYLSQLQRAQKERYTKYTDNKMLNILLSQKIKECHAKDIEIHIHSSYPKLGFLTEMDTVAIVSNLMDNAIEACLKSEKRTIFVDLYTVNNLFSAIKVENSSDSKPEIVKGHLMTDKEDKKLHGVGIKSIQNSLKKYNGILDWSYDVRNKYFRTVVMVME